MSKISRKVNIILFALMLLCGMGYSVTAQAALYDRGNGMIYDDVLKITWLQDANYAVTSGATNTPFMMFDDAKTWVNNLNYNGITGWRLPTATPANGTSFSLTTAYDGSSDVGYNITRPSDELSYMYYVNLGLIGKYSTTGTLMSNYGLNGLGSASTQPATTDIGLIQNLQYRAAYWYDVPGASATALSMSYKTGNQSFVGIGSTYYAWAVHDGDVGAAPVPIPAAAWLLGSGLMGLIGARRRFFRA